RSPVEPEAFSQMFLEVPIGTPAAWTRDPWATFRHILGLARAEMEMVLDCFAPPWPCQANSEIFFRLRKTRLRHSPAGVSASIHGGQPESFTGHEHPWQ